MEYLLLILMTLALGYCGFTLGPLWSQIILVPALLLSFSIGFKRIIRRRGYEGELLWTARILFLLYACIELLFAYDIVKLMLGLE